MKLNAIIKNILVNRLMDIYGGSVEAFRIYSVYADGVVINWDLFNSYNEGINALVKDFKKLLYIKEK